MKILITGGAGFIGSHVCENLAEHGHELIVIDDFSTGSVSNLASVEDEITLFQSRVEEFDFSRLRNIEAVVHLAAQASVPLSISEFYDSSKTNLLSSLRVIDFCSHNKIPLVYASSSAIYGGLPLGNDDSDEMDLLSPYAADKFALEVYAKVAFKTSALNSLGLRFFNVYGHRQDPSNPYSGVISIFIDRALSDREININGGEQTRDFVYVTDVAEVIHKAIFTSRNCKISDTVNVLTGKSVSIETLADKIIGIINSRSEKIYRPMLLGDPMESNGTSAKLSRVLGIDPLSLITLTDGLKLTLDEMK